MDLSKHGVCGRNGYNFIWISAHGKHILSLNWKKVGSLGVELVVY